MSSEKQSSSAEPADWEVSDKAKEIFSLARTAIPLYWPFLTAAAYRLVPRWTPLVPTMAVDKWWRLYLNPKFVETKTPPALALLIVGHELQHLLMQHHSRLMEYRDRSLIINGVEHDFANICNDLAINSSLKQFAATGIAYRTQVSAKPAGKLEAPVEAMYPENFVDKQGNKFPNGLISERYAELFEKNAQAKPKSGKAGGTGKPCSGQCGSGGGQQAGDWEDKGDADPDKPTTGVTKEEADVLARHTAEAAREQAQKHRGTVPGNMELWAEVQLSPPKIDWRKQLAPIVRKGLNWAAGRTNYSFSRPNRRAIASMSKVVLPGMYSPKPKFVVALDTSGSMGRKDYAIAFSELKSVLATCGIPKIPFFSVDAQAYDIQMISKLEDIKLTGGGGTDMGLAVKVASEIPGISLIIVLTDGVTDWCPPPPNDIRVIIVLTQKETESYPAPSWATVMEAFDEKRKPDHDDD